MLRQAFSVLQRPLAAVPQAQFVARRSTPDLRLLSSIPSRLCTRAFSSSSWTSQDSTPSRPQGASGVPPASPASQTHITLETPEPKLSLTFTCTVEACHTRSTHQFTKRSYEKGIVIVECPGCKNRHLIADHLGWFKESTQEGKLKTVEDLLRAKGEKVRRGKIDAGGVVEYAPE
ncbi:zf-DNL-domain-containing protein [Lentinus tigrinus ALCF2SS1-7]|uniref:Zf-DNL-domain-containing protein n=1 Tax=Lentinus tigrinus ALCF2SS1-6 TaxID=1328759 RepID=A0A5C2SMF5_9APHY|nr:zf-DNL-domain-containing protein [Lentinus tigrinus ALCF2SS1-6]RPD76666.1 zf-DNL-domain-containing protein [Lentinus tigrinus ALCF2SS1-7]